MISARHACFAGQSRGIDRRVLLWAVPIRDDRAHSGTVRGAYLEGDAFGILRNSHRTCVMGILRQRYPASVLRCYT
jgi:hypothetical protein